MPPRGQIVDADQRCSVLQILHLMQDLFAVVAQQCTNARSFSIHREPV
jgi:hypothetical protein